MLTALDACIDARDNITFCVYVDPDVFVQKSGGRGLVDVAASILMTRPDIFVLSGSDACEPDTTGEGNHRGCKINPFWSYISSRMLVIDRHKLKKHLPLQVSAAAFPQFFEAVFQEGLLHINENAPKTMLCPTFSGYIIHPPADPLLYDSLMMDAGMPNAMGGATYEDPDPTNFDQMEIDGLRTMIQRFEAGSFNRSRLHDCSIMEPDHGEIHSGMAW